MADKDQLELISPEIAKELMIGSVWRHHKGGTYRVLSLGYIEATLTPAVVYVSSQEHIVWIRPVSEFMDGRFERIDG